MGSMYDRNKGVKLNVGERVTFRSPATGKIELGVITQHVADKRNGYEVILDTGKLIFAYPDQLMVSNEPYPNKLPNPILDEPEKDELPAGTRVRVGGKSWEGIIATVVRYHEDGKRAIVSCFWDGRVREFPIWKKNILSIVELGAEDDDHDEE